jgi:hypothetical protein
MVGDHARPRRRLRRWLLGVLLVPAVALGGALAWPGEDSPVTAARGCARCEGDGRPAAGDDQAMRTTMRRMACGAALVAGAAGLTACGAQQPEQAAPAAASSDAPADVGQLRDALLPASAFGADATVLSGSLDQLGTALPGLGGLPEGTTVTPALCGAALAMLPHDADALPSLVARAALTDQVRSLELLADGPQLAGLPLPVDQLLATCSTVTVTAADGAATTVQLAALDVPALGDGSAGLQVTVTAPQGTSSALVGVVSTGSRALLLVQSGAAGALPDATAFTQLLGSAAEAAG